VITPTPLIFSASRSFVPVSIVVIDALLDNFLRSLSWPFGHSR
jgi:hypothetical protein